MRTGCSGRGQIIVWAPSRLARTRFSTSASRSGQFARQAAAFELVLLRALPGAADAAVLAPHERVDARVLGDGEEVRRELTVIEEVEEALHVGEVAALAFVLRARCKTVALYFVPARVEQGGVSGEAEEEAAELQVRGLVRREDLVHREVLVALDELLDELREVHGRALGAGAVLADPADALLGEVRDRMDADVGAGEGLAVQA